MVGRGRPTARSDTMGWRRGDDPHLDPAAAAPSSRGSPAMAALSTWIQQQRWPSFSMMQAPAHGWAQWALDGLDGLIQGFLFFIFLFD